MSKPGATLIGVFVAGALALVALAIVLFGSGTLLHQRIAIVSFFPGSVAGLRVGAPVSYRGVHVGEVKSIGLRLVPDSLESVVQVDMQLVPDSVKTSGVQVQDIGDVLPDMVRRGLSAQLVLESFVTGQLQVELDYRTGAKRWGHASAATEIPTVPSPFQNLTGQLQRVDVAGTVAALQRALEAAHGVLGNPRLAQTLEQLPALVGDMRQTLRTVQREVVAFSGAGRRAMSDSSVSLQAALGSVDALAQSLERESLGTLAATRTAAQSATIALDGAGALLDPQGETVVQLQRAVDDLAATAARLRNVAERVDRDPAVLIRGRQP